MMMCMLTLLKVGGIRRVTQSTLERDIPASSSSFQEQPYLRTHKNSMTVPTCYCIWGDGWCGGSPPEQGKHVMGSHLISHWEYPHFMKNTNLHIKKMWDMRCLRNSSLRASQSILHLSRAPQKMAPPHNLGESSFN